MNEEARRAEVFDALGHPTRINILKLLSHGALSFADLKKKTDIDSSGHLQHHLTKLNGLIKTDEHGNYCLSDAGNDALFAMQTVETASEKRRHKPPLYIRRSRMLLNIFIAALALFSIMSAVYLSNTSSTLSQYAVQTGADANRYIADASDYLTRAREYVNETQYAVEDQYLCDIVRGSLNDQGFLSIEWTLPTEIEPGQSFNYTAMVFSPLNPPDVVYALPDAGTIENIPPPESNDTYYRQSFLKFEVVGYSNLGSTLNSLHYYPIAGPNGWNGRILANSLSDIPPYPTAQTQDLDSPVFSGGLPCKKEFIIPIEVYGNYTFQAENTGDSPIAITYTVKTHIITLATKPLNELIYLGWSSAHGDERIARIREQRSLPTPPQAHTPQIMPDLSTEINNIALTASNIATAAVFSVATLAMLTVFATNRRKM